MSKYVTQKSTCICRKYSDNSDMLVRRSDSTRLNVVQQATSIRQSASCDEALCKSAAAADDGKFSSGDCVTELPTQDSNQRVLTCYKCGGLRIEEIYVDDPIVLKHVGSGTGKSSTFLSLRKKYSNIKKALTPNHNTQSSTGNVLRRNIPRSASAGTLKSRANHVTTSSSTTNEFYTINHNSDSNGVAQLNHTSSTGMQQQIQRRKISWADCTACPDEMTHLTFHGDVIKAKTSNEISVYQNQTNSNKNKHLNKNIMNDTELNSIHRNNVLKDDSNEQQICTDHCNDNESRKNDVIQRDNKNNKRSFSLTNQSNSSSHQYDNDNNKELNERNHFTETKSLPVVAPTIQLPNEIPSSSTIYTEQEGRASTSVLSDTNKSIMKTSMINSSSSSRSSNKNQHNYPQSNPVSNNSNSNNYKSSNVPTNSPTVINGGKKYIYFFESSNEERNRLLLSQSLDAQQHKKALGKSLSLNSSEKVREAIKESSCTNTKQHSSKLDCNVDANNNSTEKPRKTTDNNTSSNNTNRVRKNNHIDKKENSPNTSKNDNNMLGTGILKKPYAVEDLYIKSEPSKQQFSCEPSTYDENIFQLEYLSRFLDENTAADNKTCAKVSNNTNINNNTINQKNENKTNETTTLDAPSITKPKQQINIKEIRAIVENIIRRKLSDEVFDASKVTEWCKEVSNSSRDRVKSLTHDQRKIIVQTYIGPRSTQDGTQVAIKCQRESADNFITVAFEGTQFFVWVSLFLGVN